MPAPCCSFDHGVLFCTYTLLAGKGVDENGEEFGEAHAPLLALHQPTASNCSHGSRTVLHPVCCRCCTSASNVPLNLGKMQLWYTCDQQWAYCRGSCWQQMVTRFEGCRVEEAIARSLPHPTSTTLTSGLLPACLYIAGPGSRLSTLRNWLGSDECVIVFDKSHRGKNAMPSSGGWGAPVQSRTARVRT